MRFDCDNSKKCKCEARGYFIGNYKKACSVQKTDLRKPGPRKKLDCWQWENENVLCNIEGVLMFLIFPHPNKMVDAEFGRRFGKWKV